MSPKVSIITPCFNDGQFLDDARASVEAQTFTDWEHLIVDDGSTDPETLRALERLKAPKTRVLHLAHGGVTAARNFAIARAGGEYLTFFDCDDRLDPRFLEKTVAPLEADPTLAFVSFHVHLHGDEEWDWKPERCDLLSLLGDCTVATAAVVRTELVRALGGFDPRMELGHEDWDLWLSLVARGHRGVILPEVLFQYRRRPRSRSTVADRGTTYLELFRDRVRKHAESYRAQLFDVLWQKEREIQSHLDGLYGARANLEEALGPAVERARDEVRALSRAATTALERRLDEAHHELDAYRRSWSWRMTAPLRGAFQWTRRGKNSGA